MSFGLAAAGMVSGLAGSMFGNRGARREARRRQAAIRTHNDRTQELAQQRAEQQMRAGDVRRQGYGQVGATYTNPNVGGAHGQADDMMARVAARLGETETPTGGQFSDQVARFLATARQPAQDQAATWRANQVMDALGQQTQDAATGARMQSAAITPEMIRVLFDNAWSQQEADNALDMALGGYSSGAGRDEMIGAILQGLGGLGMQAAPYVGHGGR